MEEAKEVHKCLRTAAGIFTLIKVIFPLIVCTCVVVSVVTHVFMVKWAFKK
jgi:hypothetical protein